MGCTDKSQRGLNGFMRSVFSILQSVRAASTATASQPVMPSEEEPDKDQTQKQFKEASPEECDQAVEGLSTTITKEKAKQMQDSSKTAQLFIHKFWAKRLGVGPALRAVASLSRRLQAYLGLDNYGVMHVSIVQGGTARRRSGMSGMACSMRPRPRILGAAASCVAILRFRKRVLCSSSGGVAV
ncbi:LETM1-like protein [Musa troglodytarum]|uniref:LETM1-like protein n=1 Tax=Musa troglodytarum TaxID=320322 RepID=A0A9E7EGV1_9LILI|nr:LETM1-like protein [Musa troglodytarum]